MNLNEIRFKAVEGERGCDGCMFDDESAGTCLDVNEKAEAMGLPRCNAIGSFEDAYIYVPDDSDPRQIPLIDGKGEVVTKGGHE